MIEALIVDDESLVRKGLRMIFPWEKYNIRIAGEAASGEKALDFLKSQPVQLLITDITMPGMSGLELLRQVKEGHPSIKAVMLTCHQDFNYIQESLRLGAIDYIVKTQLEDQDIDEMLARIVKHFITISEPEREREDPKLPKQKWSELLSRILWVMDDCSFETLQSASQQSNDEKVDWAGIVMNGMIYWKQCFPMYTQWPEHSNLPETASQVMPWLIGLRKDLQRWLRSSTYSEDVIYAVVKSLDLIQDCYRQQRHISQTELCKKVNVSKSYFSTSFKGILGISFIRYLQWVSIEKAKEMVQNTNHPIYWIAEHCGFTDQRYFSKLFKEQTGDLPSELRQKQQKR